MKTGLTFLLAISSLCLADALQCYTCSAVNSNTVCNQNVQNCTGSDDTCMTTVATVVGLQSITKVCSTSVACNAAAAANVNLVVATNTVSCCMTDLCNVNGFTVHRLNALLLGFPAAVLVLGFVMS